MNFHILGMKRHARIGLSELRQILFCNDAILVCLDLLLERFENKNRNDMHYLRIKNFIEIE